MEYSTLFSNKPEEVKQGKGLGKTILKREGSYTLSTVLTELELNRKLFYSRLSEARLIMNDEELLQHFGVKVTSTNRYNVIMNVFKNLYPRLKKEFASYKFKTFDSDTISKEQFFQLKGLYKLKQILAVDFTGVQKEKAFEFARNLSDSEQLSIGLQPTNKEVGIHLPKGFYFLAGILSNKSYQEIAQDVENARMRQEFR